MKNIIREMMNNRKALIEQYKLKKFRIGVYQIKNIVNGKILVDGSMDLDKIWNRHQFELRLGGHRNTKLQQEWNSFGENNFCFEILSEVSQSEDMTVNYSTELKQLTKMFIEELSPYGEQGYH